MNEKDMGFPEGPYIVYATRVVPGDDYGEAPALAIETLGAFERIEDALMMKDICEDIDSTIEEVSISPLSGIQSSVPDLEVLVFLTFELDVLVVKSMAVPLGSEPYLREEENYFEMLAYPEELEEAITYACKWYEGKHDKKPLIANNIADGARSFM